jgi:hypothetical protein
MNWFVRCITFGWATEITLYPFGIYIKEKYFNNLRIRNHENIHLEQQIEMFVIPFYLWYFLEWVFKLFSYNKISFEREAKSNEYDLEYIGMRKRFAWINRVLK